jgi:MerR family regulatory protein
MVGDMDTELSIQQVAAITPLSAHTLRYYEQIGLISQQVFERTIELVDSAHLRPKLNHCVQPLQSKETF